MNNKLYLNILPETQQKLSNCEWLSEFYMAGGTALALQIGHRISIDFDFFCETDINIDRLKDNIRDTGEMEIFDEMKNTLHCQLNKVKVSFISYKYPLLKILPKRKYILLSDISDIACMKLSAISSRGNKKDFIDLFYLLKYFSIENMLDDFQKKFGDDSLNSYQIMKSLVYFDDAEDQPMPVMKNKIKWDLIKEEMIRIVRAYKI